MTKNLVLAFSSLSLLAAACGDNIRAGDDLPGDEQPGGDDPDGDGPGTGGDELPTSGPCSMNTGIHSVDVVLHDSSGAVLDSGVSDGGGLVEFSECPRDAMMTVAAYDESVGWKGATVAGVQPYSDLTVVLPGIGWNGTLMAAVPEDGADITNEYVTIATQCGAGTDEGQDQELPILAGCLGHDRGVLTVLVTGRIGDAWVYSHSDDIEINENAVTNVVADDMTGWMTGGSMPLEASNVTSDGAGFLMSWMRNGQAYYSTAWGVTIEDGSISRSLPIPPSSFSREQLVGVRGHDGLKSSGYLLRTTDTSKSFDLDDALAYIAGVGIDDDVQRPTFSATDLPQGSDLGVFRASWEADGEDVDWRIIFPADQLSTVRFPALPDTLEKATPTPASAVTSVNVIDITDQSYLDILTTGYTLDKYPQSCAELSDDARCRFSSLQNP